MMQKFALVSWGDGSCDFVPMGIMFTYFLDTLLK